MFDHFDSPRIIAESAIDITDLYAFSSAEKSGHLVLVMNVFPFAGNTVFFSDGATYRLRLRGARVGSTDEKPAFDIDDQKFSFTSRKRVKDD